MSINYRAYLTKRWLEQTGRSILYKIMPRWLVRESMMYASRYFDPHEAVPEVKFMDVFRRVCEDKTK